MLYAGIDPSISNTGIVVLNATGDVIAATNTKHTKTSDNYYLKLRDIALCVSDVLLSNTSDTQTFVEVYYEDYSFSSVNRTYRLGELGGVLRTELVAQFGTIHLVAPRLLKKFAVNRGDADKAEIMSEALSESMYLSGLPGKQLTSDICDAYFLARMGWYVGNWENITALEPNKKLLRQRIEAIRNYRNDLLNGA